MSATKQYPAIVCPDWCTVGQAMHRSQLPGWGGEVLHESDTVTVAGVQVSAGRMATPDGRTTECTDPTIGLSGWVDIGGQSVTPTDARRVARQIVMAANAADQAVKA